MAFQSDYLSSNDRDFFPVRFHAVEGSPRRNRMRFLRCSDSVCNREEEISDNGRTELPTDVVRKKFMQRGWEVGKDRSHDLCPVCVENWRLARRKPKEVELKIVTTPPPATPSTPKPILQSIADALPREMDRDERRVIFAAVEERWAPGGDSGYVTPWTDQSIAQHLGVPVSWVAEVRSQFFGEVRDNQEIRELLDRATKAAVEASQKVAEADALQKQAMGLFQKANALNASVKELKTTVEGMIAIATRIERSLK